MGCEAAAWPLRHAGCAGTEVSVKSVTRDPKRLAFVALGGNLGDTTATVCAAMGRLAAFSVTPLHRSSLWRSTPVDCPLGSPDFINAVVAFEPMTSLKPESLLAELQELEREFGRQLKTVLNEARPLDLDIIAWGDEVRSTPTLVLPHPRAHLRHFVLCPLGELAPDLVLPGQTCTVAQLLVALGPATGVKRMA
ncbi:MAG: 2-amino-4-hydroxy-6-hydroxymethyldihydropteridine diphosphokinase [Verrucomicrobia bacterium]|nr:2-amino-4-hydroxy-6-hydroxymethyldihydropteridine diphosphokinase [Verrucomicrobiota bacterium]